MLQTVSLFRHSSQYGFILYDAQRVLVVASSNLGFEGQLQLRTLRRLGKFSNTHIVLQKCFTLDTFFLVQKIPTGIWIGVRIQNCNSGRSLLLVGQSVKDECIL